MPREYFQSYNPNQEFSSPESRDLMDQILQLEREKLDLLNQELSEENTATKKELQAKRAAILKQVDGLKLKLNKFLTGRETGLRVLELPGFELKEPLSEEKVADIKQALETLKQLKVGVINSEPSGVGFEVLTRTMLYLMELLEKNAELSKQK